MAKRGHPHKVPVTHVEPDVPAVPVPAPTTAPGNLNCAEVVWTARGEKKRAHSEHGKHKEGDVVKTEHADELVRMRFAEWP